MLHFGVSRAILPRAISVHNISAHRLYVTRMERDVLDRFYSGSHVCRTRLTSRRDERVSQSEAEMLGCFDAWYSGLVYVRR